MNKRLLAKKRQRALVKLLQHGSIENRSGEHSSAHCGKDSSRNIPDTDRGNSKAFRLKKEETITKAQKSSSTCDSRHSVSTSVSKH